MLPKSLSLKIVTKIELSLSFIASYSFEAAGLIGGVGRLSCSGS